MDPRELVKELNQKNVCESFRTEPRLIWDILTFDGSTEFLNGNPDVFFNGERYPLRLTHVLAGMLYEAADQQSPVGGDERMVQRYGLRVIGHDTYYINPTYPLLPLWHNQEAAAIDITTLGSACWKFEHPVIMGRRDTIEVEVQLLVAPESGSERVSAQFHAVGVVSNEPKILSGFVDISDTVAHMIPTDFLRNDGLEPLALHKVVFNDAPPTSVADPTGNMRNVRMRMRVQGNGTNQWWVRGPVNLTPVNERCPGPLYGITAGRAVVHKIPGGGWLFGSGEGVTIEVQSIVPSREESVLIGMAGYIEVT